LNSGRRSLLPLSALSRLDPRQRSHLFQRGARNAFWNTSDYIVLPLLFLLATPFLVSRLGTEQFGIWMLVNALTGMLSVMHFGLGDATVKYVSKYRAREDWQSVVQVVRSTQTVYGSLGILSATAICLCAGSLAHHVFKIESSHQGLAIAAIRIGAIGLVLRFFNNVFAAALQGFERYDLSARVTIITKAATIGSIVVAVAVGYGLEVVLWLSVLCAAGGAVALAFVAKWLIPTLRFWPILDREALREVFGFGFYSWLSAIAGTIFSQADVLLVGVLLGTVAVTYYSVCQKLAMQVHALLAAGSAFLFPMSSVAAERGDLRQMHRIYTGALSLIGVLSAAIGVPLFLFSESILTHWMGADFALHASGLLKILVFGYALLATSIVPFNVLNGTGRVRANMVFAWLTLLIVIAGIFALVPMGGLAGVAWAKVLNIGPLLVAMAYVQRKVLREMSWTTILVPFLPVLFLFGLAQLLLGFYGNPHLNNLITLGGVILGSMALAGILGSLLQWVVKIGYVSMSQSTG